MFRHQSLSVSFTSVNRLPSCESRFCSASVKLMWSHFTTYPSSWLLHLFCHKMECRCTWWCDRVAMMNFQWNELIPVKEIAEWDSNDDRIVHNKLQRFMSWDDGDTRFLLSCEMLGIPGLVCLVITRVTLAGENEPHTFLRQFVSSSVWLWNESMIVWDSPGDEYVYLLILGALASWRVVISSLEFVSSFHFRSSIGAVVAYEA